MAIERRYKSPSERVTFSVNWAAYLSSDTITSSVWIVPTGITQVSVSNTSTQANIMLQGGTLGKIYRLLNRITTSSNEIVDQSVDIEIIEK
jgi:hypothetical protein